MTGNNYIHITFLIVSIQNILLKQAGLVLNTTTDFKINSKNTKPVNLMKTPEAYVYLYFKQQTIKSIVLI
jgi:hypothetical protein